MEKQIGKGIFYFAKKKFENYSNQNYSLTEEPSLVFSIRFWLSLLCFFLNAIHFMQRVNMSVAIVCMVDNTNTPTHTILNETLLTKNTTIFMVYRHKTISFDFQIID